MESRDNTASAEKYKNTKYKKQKYKNTKITNKKHKWKIAGEETIAPLEENQ